MKADTPTGGEPPPGPGWEPDSEPGASALLGTVMHRRVDGRLAVGFRAAPEHLNKRGVVHGGLLLAFLDHALGASTRRADGRSRVTLQLNTQFVATVKLGDFVEADCEVVRETARLQFIRAVCRVGTRSVLMADGVWQVRVPPPAA